jgi:hypothetical protein
MKKGGKVDQSLDLIIIQPKAIGFEIETNTGISADL